MRLLDRYLVRQFLPPLVFAFLAMTSIMLLNQIARRFGALVGKGLPWSVIGEVFLLCLPFIIAMTLPMAVLVAMLYTFSHLAADSEITAMRASGLSVGQLVRPMILTGVVITAANFWFTDQVLPESNARLRNLLINIQRKKPTLELREQVINEIPPLRALPPCQPHRRHLRPAPLGDHLRHGRDRQPPGDLRRQRRHGLHRRGH